MNFERIKSDLSNLLDDLVPFVDEYSLSKVKYFIEYNELKLSLEFLCEYIYDDDILLDNTFISRINGFCKTLNIDKIYWLEVNDQNGGKEK